MEIQPGMTRLTGLSGGVIMQSVRIVSLCLIAGGLLSLATASGADPGVTVVKDTRARAEPPHETVRLESAEVIFRLQPASYLVDAVFVFFNSGETTTESVFVPATWGTGCHSTLGFIRFDATVDREEALVSEERVLFNDAKADSEDLARPVHRFESRRRAINVTFPGHAATTIRVKCEDFYKRERFTNIASFNIEGRRPWKGKVGKRVMVRDASALGGTKEWFTGSLERPGARVITHDVDRYESVDVDPQEGTRFGTYVDVRLKAHRRQVTPK